MIPSRSKVVIIMVLFLLVAILMLWWSQWIWTVAFLSLFVCFWFLSYWLKDKKGIFISIVRIVLFPIALFFLAIWVRLFLFEVYSVPTPSMSPTIKAGAVLLAEKWSYGFNKPTTLAQIPWLNVLAGHANKNIELNFATFRTGFHKIQNGDIIVFFPPYSDIPHVKRCIAIAGDSVAVSNGLVSINGKITENSPAIYPFLVSCGHKDAFLLAAKSMGVSVVDEYPNGFKAFMSIDQKVDVERFDGVDSITFFSQKSQVEMYSQKAHSRSMIVDTSIEKHAFLSQLFPNLQVTAYWFPTIYIPRKGERITLNDSTFRLYRPFIENEGNTVDLENDKVKINGVAVYNYQFEYNHYFMMGDNRVNSLDSKDWGTVSQNRIIGKVLFIWN